jgi:hypothetical protein
MDPPNNKTLENKRYFDFPNRENLLGIRIANKPSVV